MRTRKVIITLAVAGGILGGTGAAAATAPAVLAAATHSAPQVYMHGASAVHPLVYMHG